MTLLRILCMAFGVLAMGIQYGCAPLPSIPAPASNPQVGASSSTSRADRNEPSSQRFPASYDGIELVISHPHSRFTSAVALSPDERYIVSGSHDGTAKLWNVASGQVVRTFPRLFGLTGMGVDEVTFSNEGDKIAVSGIGDRNHQFDVATGRELAEELKLTPHDISPDGRLRVSEPGGMSNGLLNVEDVATRRTVHTLDTGMTSVWGRSNTLRFSRDGRHFAWAGVDLVGGAIAKIWEVRSWKVVATLPASAVNFSRDSRTLVLGGLSGTAPYLRDLASGEETQLALTACPSAVTDIAIASNGRSVLAGMSNGNTILWDLANGQSVRSFECPKGQAALSVAFALEKSLGASGCADGSVWLWDVSTGKQIRNLASSLSHPVLHMMTRFSFDGRALVYDTGEQVNIWNVDESKETRRLSLPQSEVPYVSEYKIKMGESEKEIHASKNIPEEEKEKFIKDMKQATQSLIERLTAESSVIQALAVEPNGHTVALAQTSGVFLVETSTGQVVRRIDSKLARYLVFSPDGQTLMSEKDAWDPSTGRIREIASKNVNVNSSAGDYMARINNQLNEVRKVRGPVAVSVDGQVAARATDLTIKVWNMVSGQTQELTGHAGKITGLCFTPNNRVLVSGSDDGSVRLWDLQSGKEFVSLVSLGNSESLAITADHFYRASKSPTKGVSFQVGDQLVPLEQFAEKLNKPDIVQQRLREFFSDSTSN